MIFEIGVGIWSSPIFCLYPIPLLIHLGLHQLLILEFGMENDGLNQARKTS